MSIQNKISTFLHNEGAQFIHYIDISHLPKTKNKGYTTAVLFGKALSKSFVKKVSSNLNYVSEMIERKQIKSDEFHLTELETDRIADALANYIHDNGFKAFSQSENNLEKSGNYNFKSQSSPLPHKTIALIAGMGWIGKHNLLVTHEYGSAVSMCTVLTDAPLQTVKNKIENPNCGECTICFDVCSPGALTNTIWEMGIERDELLTPSKCTTCLQCMMQCPFSQKYARQ